MVCLDTDIIIDALHNEKRVAERLINLRKESHLTTTSINTFELFKCTSYTKDDKEKMGLGNIIMSMKILSFDLRISEKAGEIFENLRSKGQAIELTDVMIAAFCIVNDESLLTKNTRHFARIPGLKLEKL
ncbi:type II toxin-antitoxin system VapC family toxin [Candidatus Pacearchaeota archaeon]|nr:type II toxin-antitoxin system VapC family toxin [Candidatus Pacearchaeota archaeon]